MLPTISLVLLAIVVVAIVLSQGAALLEERRFLEKHAAVSADELVERATALLRDGEADGAARAELLTLLAKRDYDGMLASMRRSAPWDVGPQGHEPAKDMESMRVAGEKNTELRLIVTTLSRRGGRSDASDA